ncbi:MAG: ferrous iron transporter B, partial [Proteobacteria bacterium]|nr:ferrous iron transporter B [Pseudomonadota bacterium]
MTRSSETRIPVADISVRRQADASIAVVGSPNSGKSTLFNRLTGLRQRIGNYPGVTVERHVGSLKGDDYTLELIDLPGTHALSAHSIEEQLVVDVIFGRLEGTSAPDGILAVVDATNLYQGLYLVQQLTELETPLVLALTMVDAAEAKGLRIDVDKLAQCLGGIPVCPVVATTGAGIGKLKLMLAKLPDMEPAAPVLAWPELTTAARKLAALSTVPMRIAGAVRLLIDEPTALNHRLLDTIGNDAASKLDDIRAELFGAEPALAREARMRFSWVRDVLADVQQKAPPFHTWRTRLAEWVNRPVPGTIGLFLVMAIMFQAVFAWATPMMELIDRSAAVLGALVAKQLGGGAFSSLVTDGIIAGVGSVIIFLPQIIILFLFIILLEDSGYLARAAYLLDRTMR